MDNYEYIVASLPAISQEWKFTETVNADTLLGEIRENCSARDNALIDFLVDGFDETKLDADFYRKALAHRNRFLRGYFLLDLNLRNSKVRFLNKRLGRPAAADVLTLEGGEMDGADALDAVFESGDLLEREKRIDALMWERISELTVMDDFDIEFLLGFIAKLHIIDRWWRLDEATGRELFRKLTDEVRGTFRGVQYDAAHTA